MYRLTKLAADGTDLPADATGHLAVRLEHSLLAAPVIWTAHRSPERLTWAEAKAWAEKLDVNGWSWRLPTVEEAFLLPDRTRVEYPALDPSFFPDCDGEWIWTGTEYARDPGSAGCAWGVGLGNGGSDVVRQSSRFLVRAVRSGQ
jgi:hypothetical protein